MSQTIPLLFEKRWPFALRFKNSVIPRIILKVFALTVYSAGIVALFKYVLPQLNMSGALINVLGMVLSLLLVFRTNTAYDRYWEGRRLWSSQVVNVRNLTRMIWVHVYEKDENDRKAKGTAVRLLIAFIYATKHYLRKEYNYDEVTPEFAPFLRRHHSQYRTPTTLSDYSDFIVGTGHTPSLETSQQGANLPLEIAVYLSAYIQNQRIKGNIDIPLFGIISGSVNNLIECLSGFERILHTPIPMAYSIHLSQTLLVYCLMLPLQMAEDLGWIACFVTGLASFTMFGILAIGQELENPFGYDWNDLPLDNLCQVTKEEIMAIVSVAPPSIDSWLFDEPETLYNMDFAMNIPGYSASFVDQDWTKGQKRNAFRKVKVAKYSEKPYSR
ncbi:hypothetical protein K7432_005159 [Basidiobolus ranarum]|uniref:Uncharacterized protein n=1 Tax=Basidiobolus ranarum TaxID=34480 RepID=A0ABR2W3J1_9FUNG